jgi:hypothetical protein
MRTAARLSGDINDPGTVDLFSRTVQLHEKRVVSSSDLGAERWPDQLKD